MRFNTLFTALLTLAACEGDVNNFYLLPHGSEVHDPNDSKGPASEPEQPEVEADTVENPVDDTDELGDDLVEPEVEADTVEELECDKEPFVHSSQNGSWESYSYPIVDTISPNWSYPAGTTDVGVGARVASLIGDECDEGFWVQDMFLHLTGLPNGITLTQADVRVEIDGVEALAHCTTFSNGTSVVGYRCFPSFGQPGLFVGPHDLHRVQINVRGLNPELPAGTELDLNLCLYFEDEATGDANMGHFGVPVEFCMYTGISLY